jgi:hypothetical protein
MTRKEIAKLLEIIKAAYPYWKIDDAKATLDVWQMELGSYEAEQIYKSARYLIGHSTYIPSIAEIIKGINKGQLLYGVADQSAKIGPGETLAIEAPKKDIRESLCKGSCICPYFGWDCDGTIAEQEICNL